MLRTGSIVLATLIALPMAASALPAQLVGNSISVDYHPTMLRADYWCAAGAAVISAGMDSDTMIYRTSALQPKVGEGMTFSLRGSIQGPWNIFAAHKAANLCPGADGGSLGRSQRPVGVTGS